MRFSTTLSVAWLAITAQAIPTNVQRHVLHEKRDTSSERYAKRDRVRSDVVLPMRFGLTQTNLHNGHDLLMEVSDPQSPKYGQHYTVEQIDELFAPGKDTSDAVVSWLHDAGVHPDRISTSENRQWIQVDLAAWEAEALLQTQYHFFEHTSTGKATIGCDAYHVHEGVRKHIDYILPGVNLIASRKPLPGDIEKRSFGWGNVTTSPPLLAPMPLSLAQLLSDPALANCDTVITPPCIQAMYNFTNAQSAVSGNQLGIFEDLGDKYAQQDLDMFFTTLQSIANRPNPIPAGTHPTLDSVDGATAPATVTNAGAESDLDFQISYPIIWPQNSILYQTDDDIYEANYTYSGFFNNFLYAIDGSYCNQAVAQADRGADPPYPHRVPGGYMRTKDCGRYRPTNVVSISYGGQEFDETVSYQRRQCAEYLKLGLQGVSIVVSSGDSGVAGPNGDDSANGCLYGGTVFSPDFPVTCPYVTAAGSTVLTDDPKQDQEIATTRFPSGGGFSNIYPIPSYQRTAVQNYINNPAGGGAYQSYTYNRPTGNQRYNRTGRAYPDVSAVGDNILIYNKGAPTLIGGTSASAPVFASLLTRINDERLKRGRRPVGFVNPTLYAHPEMFHDITQGSNPGCGTNGFAAVRGWDPVTGLGTPNYPALLRQFLSQ